MPKPIAPEQFPNLISLINETYTDAVEEIVDARLEDNNDILVVAKDGIKQLAVRITESNIAIRMINADEVEAQSDTSADAPAAPATVNLSDPLPKRPDSVAQFVEQLQRLAQPEMTAMLETVRQLLEESQDLQEFAAKLDEAYPKLNSETLTSVMAEAMFASRLAGVFEAEEEASGD